jgi:hypothetical protein
VTLIVSVLILAVVVGGVLWLYRGGVKGGDGSPPTVSAPAGADRTAAPAQTTPPDASAGLSIYKDNGAPAAGPPTFAPPPEQPGARPAPPAPSAAPAAPPVAPVAAKAKSGDEIGDLLDKPSAAPAKAPKPFPTTKPPAEKPTKPPVAKTPAAAADAPPAAGAAEVQIGAFSTRAQADQGWGAAAAAAPGGMAGRGKKVEEISKDGKTLYRTSITGFTSRESAQALCARLQAAGRSCFVR